MSAARDALRAALEEVETDHIVTKQAAETFADEAAAALFSPLPRPRLALNLSGLLDHVPGEPFPDTDGNLWKEIVFGDDGPISGRAEDGTFHQWGTGEQLHDAVLRATRR